MIPHLNRMRSHGDFKLKGKFSKRERDYHAETAYGKVTTEYQIVQICLESLLQYFNHSNQSCVAPRNQNLEDSEYSMSTTISKITFKTALYIRQHIFKTDWIMQNCNGRFTQYHVNVTEDFK
jgi:hypothetical protein